MELNKDDVVTMARSEAQFVRTNSGDAVYLFVHEGLLRFADKMARYTEKTMLAPNLPVAPQQLAPWQTQPQPDHTKGLMARIAELEVKLLESSESVINIGRELKSVGGERDRLEAENKRMFNARCELKSDIDKCNRRIVDLMAERDRVQRKVEENCKVFIKIDSCIEDWRKI